MSIKVILADDHDVVREGIRRIITRKAKDIDIIGEASTGKEVFSIARQRPADLYLLDISMPELNGIETTYRLTRKYPKSKVIILSMHDDKKFVEKALQCGAKGYLLKSHASDEVISAIREVYGGNYYLSAQISNFVVKNFIHSTRQKPPKKNQNELSTREKEIVQLITEGFNNREIASRLKISVHTIHAHRNNIMSKLNIHRQADLIRYAYKEGLAQL